MKKFLEAIVIVGLIITSKSSMYLYLLALYFLSLILNNKKLDKIQAQLDELQKHFSIVKPTKDLIDSPWNITKKSEGGYKDLEVNTKQLYSATEEQSLAIQDEIRNNIREKILNNNTFKNYIIWLRDNWTGMLGSGVLVLGLSFAGIYMGLNASPAMRCIMLYLLAILFLVVSLLLRKKLQWQDLSAWLQGVSGAITLFISMGSYFFEVLRFYDSALAGLILLVSSIIYNLIIANCQRLSYMASFHVILCLIALSLSPKEPIILLLAFITTLFGLLKALRNNWDAHILIILISYSLYAFWWGNNMQIVPMSSLILFSGVAIGVISLIIPYKRISETNEKPYLLPLISHITSWITIIFFILVWKQGFKWSPLIAALAGISILCLAQIAKRKRCRWLFLCDSIIGQMSILYSFILMHDSFASSAMIPTLVIIEVAIFNVAFSQTNEKILSMFGSALFFISALVFIFIITDAAGFSPKLTDGLSNNDKKYLVFLVLSVICISQRLSNKINALAYNKKSSNPIS